MTNEDSWREGQWYAEATASVSPQISELFSHYLFESGADGVEELESTEKAVKLKAYFPAGVKSPTKILEEAFRTIGDSSKNFEINSIEKLPVQDWRSNWKEYFKPLSVGRSFLIRPPWETPNPSKREIVIHPGQGFGTGYHESTRLALELLERLGENHEFEQVVDVGTGSGILAIAALLLKAKHVTAIDIDREALSEVPENLALSGINPALCSVLLKEPDQLKIKADLVIANIEYDILKNLIESLAILARKSAYLILSGLLTVQRDALISQMPESLTIVEESRCNEWSAFILKAWE